MSISTSSLAFGCGFDLWFGGLFTAAELAAADLLVQLSVAGGDEAASSSTTTVETSSPRSVNTCFRVTAASGEEEQEDVEEMGLSTTVELDRRARKRYRLLSELYAATMPVKGGASKKRRRYDDESEEEEEEAEALRYGEYY